MGRARSKRVVVQGASIWPQPKVSAQAKYRITFRAADGRRVTVMGSPDLEVTVEMAQRIVRREERARLGLPQAEEDRLAEQDMRPIEEHLADWQATMEAEGSTPKHIRQFIDCARGILLGQKPPAADAKRGRGRVLQVQLDGVGARRISEIQPSKVQREVGKVKAASKAATANRYLNAVRAFLNWGVSDRRWRANVCEHLPKYNVDEDRAFHRRAITAQQFRHLLEVTEASHDTIAGLTGLQRSLVYRFCVATGLRRKEVRAVRVSDMSYEGTPGVWVQAKVGKNRKRAFQPLPGSMVAEIREHVKRRDPADPLFDVPSNTARMLKKDLKAAGIPYETPDGRFDFHAIRHESGALLIAAGMHVTAVQKHMRHAQAKLTLDTYGHLLDSDRERLVKLLPDFSKAQRDAQRESGIECRQTSPDDAVPEPAQEKTPENRGSEDWSHGESNPDLLNAIQPSSR
jgi:integrase